jgi:hypothetical protein
MSSLRTSAVLAALVVLPALSGAQTLLGRTDSVFTWRGALPSGALLTVRNHNGPIDVRPASGSQVELRAEKRSRYGNLTDVAFDIRTEGNGDVTICSTLRGNDPCENDRRSWDDDDDGRRSVSVAMTVLVPRGARVRVGTGNGAVSVERVGGEVSASTGNGRVNVLNTEGTVRVSTGNGDVQVRDAAGAVRVSTGNGRVSVTTAQGPVEARSGNGDIDVRMTALRAAEDMTFSTGSGDVRVTLPASYNGELDASTGNGTISSDFDLKVEGRMSPRRVRATIGSGGARLRLSSGNGGLELKKAQ